MRRDFDPRFGEGVTGVVTRYRGLVLLAAVIIGQLLVMAYQLRRNQDIPVVRAAVVYVVSPVQRALLGTANSFRNFWDGYVSLWGTHRQNQQLNQTVDDLKLENQRLREQAAEGRRLQVLFDLRQQLPLPTVAAQVLSTGASETARIIMIDKGASSGLKPDLPVLVPDGVVGKILHVFPDTAQVLLITDPYSGVACLLENSRVHGILKGQNKPLPTLGYVPNGDEVKPGQMVFTSGEDQIYPKGIPVGVVVSATPGAEFQQITVQPVARLNRLEEVLVITQSGGDIGKFPMAEKTPPAEAPVEAAFGPSEPPANAAGGVAQALPPSTSASGQAPLATPPSKPPTPPTAVAPVNASAASASVLGQQTSAPASATTVSPAPVAAAPKPPAQTAPPPSAVPAAAAQPSQAPAMTPPTPRPSTQTSPSPAGVSPATPPAQQAAPAPPARTTAPAPAAPPASAPKPQSSAPSPASNPSPGGPAVTTPAAAPRPAPTTPPAAPAPANQ
jgi:rod shape-determining protein MreC